MFGALARRTRAVLQFRRDLARLTPLIDGRETRRVSRALRYDPDKAGEMIDAVPFEPRATYPERALQWCRAHG